MKKNILSTYNKYNVQPEFLDKVKNMVKELMKKGQEVRKAEYADGTIQVYQNTEN